MKKLSKSKINYRKHERDMFARQERREAKKQSHNCSGCDLKGGNDCDGCNEAILNEEAL